MIEQRELLGRVWDNWHPGWRQRIVRRVAPALAQVLDDIAAQVMAEMRSDLSALRDATRVGRVGAASEIERLNMEREIRLIREGPEA